MKPRLVLILVVLVLAGCGREASVSLSGGREDADPRPERTAAVQPGDAGADAPSTGAPGPDAAPPRAPGADAPSPGASGGSPGSPGSAAAAPDDGGRGIAVGEPNPGASECPECSVSHEPGGEPPASDPEPDPYTRPRPGQEDVRARPWESAEVHEDDRTVDLRYWSGVEPCNVLDRVDVREEASRVVITLYEGRQPGFDGACTEQAVERRTQVRLSAPLAGRELVDGARER